MFSTYLLCYKGLSKTFSGSCVGTVTADICLSGNGLRKLVTTLDSTLLSCLDLKLELENPASIPGWNLSNRVTILSLSRSLHSLRSFHADGAFSILTHLVPNTNNFTQVNTVQKRTKKTTHARTHTPQFSPTKSVELRDMNYIPQRTI